MMLLFLLVLFSFSDSNLFSNQKIQKEEKMIKQSDELTPTPSEIPKLKEHSKIPTIVGILFLVFFVGFLVIFFWFNRAPKVIEYSNGLSQSSLLTT